MTDTPNQDSSDNLGPLPPGRSTRDYARDSMQPFQPLVRSATPPPAPPTPMTPVLAPVILAGIAVLSAATVIGLGVLLLT